MLVRIQTALLRALFALMIFAMGVDAWRVLLTHSGDWDPMRALAFCVWAAYGSLAVFGVFQPLRWLPIVLFMVFYKTLWILIVALPLWRSGMLAGSSADELAHIFVWAPLVLLLVPWSYVWRTYVVVRK